VKEERSMPNVNKIMVTVELDDTLLREQLKTMRETQEVLNAITYFNIYLTNHKDENSTLKYRNHLIAVNSMMNEYIRLCEKLKQVR